MLTCWDREFQAELVSAAKWANNERFFENLGQFLTGQEQEYSKHCKSLPKAKPTLKLSPNYNPIGMGFQDFLETKGLYYYPQQFVRFFSGGAFESQRRRH